jgi:exosome complex component RRP41|eukprot:scaffold2361_cov203-Alexandrium_tamarense.AAC.20
MSVMCPVYVNVIVFSSPALLMDGVPQGHHHHHPSAAALHSQFTAILSHTACHHRATLEVTMRTSPFSPPGDRRVTNPTSDRRLIEQSHLLQTALSASILLHLYPKSKISVTVMVLADDGGRLEAAINAATLALIDAGIPLKDMVCACSAGRWSAGGSDEIVVDLNRREIQAANGTGGGGNEGGGTSDTIYLPVAAMPQRGTVVLAQCESRLSGGAEAFGEVLEAAMGGCQMVMEVMAAAVRERGAGLWKAKEGNADVVLEDW